MVMGTGTVQGGAADQAFSSQGARTIVAAAAARGVAAEVVLDAVGLRPADLDARDLWLPESAEWTMWESAARRLNDPAFGLHAGESLVDSEYPEVLYQAARHSPTVGAALDRLARYFAVVNRRVRLRLEQDGDVALLIKDDRSRAVPSPHGSLVIMTNTLLRLRRMLGRFPLREVWFSHRRPADDGEYSRVFGIKVQFGRPYDALVCDRAQLDWPMPHRTPMLLRVLDEHLSAATAEQDDGFVARVRELLAAHLRDAANGVQETARRLGMSPRTLQRRLQESGQSFQGLLDDVRRELALRHLEEDRLSMCELAEQLGFADLRPFYRAFKRWTGTAPGRLRARRATA